MNINELYNQLAEAYKDQNLNEITGKLIAFYKNKNFIKLREIANKISRYVSIDDEKDAKLFSKLIMLYHPDKGEQYRQQLKSLYEKNDLDRLEKYSHILLIQNIKQSTTYTIDESVDFNPEYNYDASEADGFSFTNDSFDPDDSEDPSMEDFERNFYNMIKIREYGNVAMEFPPYYLEDFDEFEMAYSGLESLEGVEHCIHVKILDVSNNQISDIENLWDLHQLEELYMANNEIGYIDTLSNLTNLKVLDISGNQIDDLTPLFNLEQLEYVNLIGNKVPVHQIKELEQKGIVVLTDQIPHSISR